MLKRNCAPLWLQEGVARSEETRWRTPLPFDEAPGADEVAAYGQKRGMGPEIDKMLGWLEDWGVEYDPDSMGGMDHGSMGGDDSMMSEEDMTMLESADAVEANSLFLEQMIVHHEGAVDMAQTALDDAQNPDVLELAQQVIDDQTAEIATMQELLGQL